MPDSYNIKTAQKRFSSLVQEAEDHPVTITRQGEPVVVMMSLERMESIAETMEILSDSKAMEAIQKSRDGSAKYHDLSVLDKL